MIKEYYKRRKVIGNVFLEMGLEIDLGLDLGRVLPVRELSYKAILHKNDKTRARVGFSIYNVGTYKFYISSNRCRFYRESVNDMGEGIIVPNARELWRFLKRFETDAKYRLAILYSIHDNEMNEYCKKIIEQILDAI